MTTKICIIGFVDHGKSCLTGSLMLKTDNVRSFKETDKQNLAHLSAVSDDEKERGITLHNNEIEISYRGMSFTLIDTPGHVTLAHKMVKAISQSNVILLVISIKPKEFKSSLSSGHLLESLSIIRSLGFKDIIICINKMDLVNWDQAKYDIFINNMNNRIKRYKFRNIQYIPVSAKQCRNITDVYDTEVCKMSLFDAIRNSKLTKLNFKMIQPKDGYVNGLFLIINITGLLIVGYNCSLHSGDKIYNCEIISLNNGNTKFITEKQINNKSIGMKLKINSNDTIYDHVILRNSSHTICSGILYDDPVM